MRGHTDGERETPPSQASTKKRLINPDSGHTLQNFPSRYTGVSFLICLPQPLVRTSHTIPQCYIMLYKVLCHVRWRQRKTINHLTPGLEWNLLATVLEMPRKFPSLISHAATTGRGCNDREGLYNMCVLPGSKCPWVAYSKLAFFFLLKTTLRRTYNTDWLLSNCQSIVPAAIANSFLAWCFDFRKRALMNTTW